MSLCKVFWFVLNLSLCFSSSVDCSDNFAAAVGGDSLDAFIGDFAFSALVRHRPHTGALYKAILPANMSGMEVSIVRLRSRTLWIMGANFSNFHIPPGTIPVPYVKRLAIVYQNLGNWSSYYYSVPGYSLITSVVGFLAFDASNNRAKSIRNISLSLMGKGRPTSISFPNLTFPDGKISGARCVLFSSNGTVHFTEMASPNVCYTSEEGHFSVVVGVKGKQKPWYPWVIGLVLGSGILVLAGYFGVVFIRLLKSKKIQAMERQADDGVIFGSRWVGNSKMPCATVIRTQPVLESGNFP